MFMSAETIGRASRGRVSRAPQIADSLMQGSLPLVLAIGLGILSAGCLVQKREKIQTPAAAPASLRTATLDELLEKIQKQQDAIQTIDATVQLEPSVSSAAKGEITTYHDVRAFLLIRKPAFLRMIGQYPVVRNTAFDLVSDGERFGLYIPSKNRYITGNSRGGKRGKSPLENLRPQHILDALLWKGPEPGSEQAALELVTEAGKSYYVVLILRQTGPGRLALARKLWFERVGLSLERLQIFDDQGEVATDARYSSYAEFSGVPYAQQIVLNRPLDDYGLILSFTKLVLNGPIADDKFKMEPPAGAEKVDLEQASSS